MDKYRDPMVQKISKVWKAKEVIQASEVMNDNEKELISRVIKYDAQTEVVEKLQKAVVGDLE